MDSTETLETLETLETPQAPPETPEPQPFPDDDEKKLSWLEKQLKLWGLTTQIGHDGFMLAKIAQQHQEVMKLAKAGRTGKIGKPDVGKDDEVEINIGNESKEYHQHYHYENKPVTEKPSAPAVAVEAVKAVVSKSPHWLKTAGLAAALVGLPALGASVPWMLGAYKASQTIVNQAPAFDPTQWQLEIVE